MLLARCILLWWLPLLLAIGGCAGELDEGFEPVATTATSHDAGSTAAGGSGGGSVGPDELVYRPTIQSDLETAGCVAGDCHGAQGIPMAVAAAPASDSAWEANYAQVKPRALSHLLLTKPTGAGAHPKKLDAGSPLLARWSAWVEQGAPYQK